MNKKIILFVILVFTLTFISAFDVLGANCYGNSTDEAGCTWTGTVTQTEDLDMTGQIDGVGIWDCDGHKLTIKNGQSLFLTNYKNERNGRVINCEITSDSSDGTVWEISAPSTDGITDNHYIIDSTIYDVNIVMSAYASSHAYENFYVDNVGIANSTIYDVVQYVIYSNSALSQDGVRGMNLYGNNISDSNIGVERGSTLVTYCDSQGFGTWDVIGNTFTNMTVAGIQNNRGCSAVYIEDNVFDGANSGILSTQSNIRNSGNTFLNNALGQNGCYEPPIYGFSMVVSTNDIPMCDGEWNQSSEIVLETNAIAYPQTSDGVGLYSSGLTTSMRAENHFQGATADNVEVTDFRFYNFTTAIHTTVNCYNHAYNEITDTMSNWDINGNTFYGDLNVSDQVGYLSDYDDWNQCSIDGLTLRDNDFFNLSKGYYLWQHSSDSGNSGRKVYSDVEISFSDFTNVTYGVYEYGVQYSDAIVVFNNFINSNTYVLHSGFDWFGNVGYGDVYIQDQNDCQKPDLLYYYDRDVTLCSGEYILEGESSAILPYSNVDIFCDGTIMQDNVPQSNPAIIMNTYYSGLKPSNVYNIEISGCTFDDFQMGVELIGNLRGGAGYGNYIHDNIFTDMQYGIMNTNDDDYTSTGYGWVVDNNVFHNMSVAGIELKSAVSGSGSGMNMYNWNITNNNFTNSEKGIYVLGSEYSTSYCGNNPKDILIEDNYFDNNEWHVEIHNPDAVQCPTYPSNISGHGNVFSREFGAFAIKNTAGENQDWTLNNWGTGFTGVIDSMIYDSNDDLTFGLIDYIPITGYTLVFGNPFAVDENWETAPSTQNENMFYHPITYQATGYSDMYVLNGNEEWNLARTSSNANGNVEVTNDAYCINNYCYRADVGSLTIDPQYTRLTRFFDTKIDLTSETLITFSLNYQSEYWQSGGAMILRNDADEIVLQVDLGLTNESKYSTFVGSGGCSIQAITGDAKEGLQVGDDQWTTYSIDIADIESNCPQYSSVSDVEDIDRVEFVFGGTQLGVLGNIQWYLDDVSIENVDFQAPPIIEPPQGAVVLWQETFGDGYNFNLDESDCDSPYPNGITSSSWSSITPSYVGGDNEWACYLNQSSGVSVNYKSEYDQTLINSPLGIRHINYGTPEYWSSFSSIEDWSEDLTDTTNLMFSCSAYNSTGTYNYLVLGSSHTTEFLDIEATVISLQNGGCDYWSDSPSEQTYSNQCCELYNITGGDDCASTPYRNDFDLEWTDVTSNGCLSALSDFDRVEIVSYKHSANTDNFYIDDIYLYASGIIGNNSLPTFIFLEPLPNPQEPLLDVDWSFSLGDSDDPLSTMWTAFDCENDGVLDFAWGQRGEAYQYVCTYPIEATYTGKLWYMDDTHYPDLNLSATNSVNILDVVEEPSEAPTQGGTCAGFTSPVCPEVGTCWLYDDFNYDSFAIECNGWDGSGDTEKYHPVNSSYKVIDFDLYEDGIDWIGDRVSTNQYYSVDVEFDLNLDWTDGSGTVQMFLADTGSTTKYLMNFAVQNYLAKAFGYTSTINIGTMTQNTWHTFKANVDMENSLITWYMDETPSGTIEFYDSGEITGFDKLILYWSDEDGIIKLDNVKISYADANPNATFETETSEYVYNPNLFCAINWTGQTGDRFSEQNCIDRGFSVEYPLLSLCVPRACLQDVGLSMIDWATSNIFQTIIIVTAFILIAPLIVALAKKRN